jgi:predicted site-specific integrase-resolvase
VLVLHPDEDQTVEEELASDMIALVTSFAGRPFQDRLYGRRSHKTKEIVACVREKTLA